MGVVLLSIHKMAAGQVSERHVWAHSSSAVACTQFETKKGTSTQAEHSFDMWKVYIHVTVLELCVSKRKKKKKNKKEERRRKNMNKIKIFMFVFLSFCMG